MSDHAFGNSLRLLRTRRFGTFRFAGSQLCAPLITFCPVLVKEVFQGDISHVSLSVGAFGASR